jgi:hypothetical protein
MSSYLDSIPQAVATIVSSYVNTYGQGTPAGLRDDIEKRVIALTEQLIGTFAKALRDAESAIAK